MQNACHPSRHSFAFACIWLLLLFAIPARADRRQLEDALKPAFQNKTVFLRGFYSDSKLHFDRLGNAIGAPTQGNWTVDGKVLINNLSVDRHNLLTLKGKRIISVFDQSTGKFVNKPSNDSIQITVELDPSWQDAAPVLALLDKVMPSALEQFSVGLPHYWQCWASGNASREKEGTWTCFTGQRVSKTKIDQVGGAIKPPRVLSRTQPTFTRAARALHLQGITLLSVIIDQNGEPHLTGIARPLGAGMDDQAIECIRKWRFAPATRDGNPVAVEVVIEVNYQLLQ